MFTMKHKFLASMCKIKSNQIQKAKGSHNEKMLGRQMVGNTAPSGFCKNGEQYEKGRKGRCVWEDHNSRTAREKHGISRQRQELQQKPGQPACIKFLVPDFSRKLPGQIFKKTPLPSLTSDGCIFNNLCLGVD